MYAIGVISAIVSPLLRKTVKCSKHSLASCRISFQIDIFPGNSSGALHKSVKSLIFIAILISVLRRQIMNSLKRITFSTLVIITFVISATLLTFAQARLQVPQVSQKASVMQRIGLSEISVVYSRPAAKGRKVYGDWPTEVKGEATLDNQNARPKDAPLVPWGHVWRAGANENTTITYPFSLYPLLVCPNSF